MIPIFSLVTSVKDYLEVVHKLIEYDSINLNYTEFGSILTYVLISFKNSLVDFVSLSWLKNLGSLPIIIPDISSAMVSEISVLDGYFHNAFQFLDTPVSYGEQNKMISCLEKFSIGLINSLFLFLPTSTAHIITLRRFVMQGLEAGYISGLGTIAGNMFWLSSIILGWRFFVIPWLSLDTFRYILGFLLLVKYMWDTYNEKKGELSQDGNAEFLSGKSSAPSAPSAGKTFSLVTLTVDSVKTKFFLLNFLLALTEQTSIYPFISDFAINPEASLLETFSSGSSFKGSLGTAISSLPLLGREASGVLSGSSISSFGELGSAVSDPLFILIHLSYLLGIGLGSLSLLHFSCWFWENPAFKIYLWVISSTKLKVSTSFFYKGLNFTFLYLTMVSAITSIPYYGLDYTITNPLGYVSDDRIIQDKVVLETSFLGTKASDRNTRRNRGRHGRRERWKRRIRKYRTFDASLYDQGIYDLFTIEDLNYGFDRFWLRRKLRNHRVRFRFFPGPWMRSFKKQLAKPRLESYTGPRIEFFRILFEQVYHPSFHAFSTSPVLPTSVKEKYRKEIPNLSFNINLSLLNDLPRSHKVPSLFPTSQKQESSVFTGSFGEKPILPFPSANLTEGSLRNEKSVATKGTKDTKDTSVLRSNPFPSLPTGREGTAAVGVAGDSLSKVLKVGNLQEQKQTSFLNTSLNSPTQIQNHLIQNNLQKSTLRKFVRKVDSRFKTSVILSESLLPVLQKYQTQTTSSGTTPLISNVYLKSSSSLRKNSLPSLPSVSSVASLRQPLRERDSYGGKEETGAGWTKAEHLRKNSTLLDLNPKFSKKSLNSLEKQTKNMDFQILRYRSLLMDFNSSTSTEGRSTATNKTSVGLFPSSYQEKEQNSTQMLLHPLKFYLQQDAGLKRKWRYYTPSVFRKFSIENNAPYFRVMMKRYFYHYKPTLRWERTMKVASLRKARRKTTRIPRKLQYSPIINSSSDAFDSFGRNSSSISVEKGALPFPLLSEGSFSENKSQSSPFEQRSTLLSPFGPGKTPSELQKNTYNYSVVSKRASRYRYEIYKDVLQHWYYSPFNRFLLKLDVDSFIRRQPKAHFLTEKEENLLHLRRFLLSEHYNTLRWYTNMEHYRSMKTQLNGSTKSLSSGVYNQQFMGTFKKIRHLFAITPSQVTDGRSLSFPVDNKSLEPSISALPAHILKFDQPLYNEYGNTSVNPLLNPLIIHEELLDPISLNPTEIRSSIYEGETSPVERTEIGRSGNFDLLSQSQNIVRNYLIHSQSDRDNYIKKLLNENNYVELTKFIYKGKKIRGNEPVTSQRLLNSQEKDYLLTYDSLQEIHTSSAFSDGVSFPEQKGVFRETPFSEGKDFTTEGKRKPKAIFGENNGTFGGVRPEDFYLTYLKKWKKRVNDQESFKNYLTRRVDKREKRKLKKEKLLAEKLKRLETWGFSLSKNGSPVSLLSVPSVTRDLPMSSETSSNQNFILSSNGSDKQNVLQNSKTVTANTELHANVLTSGLRKSIQEGSSIIPFSSGERTVPSVNNPFPSGNHTFGLPEEGAAGNTPLFQRGDSLSASKGIKKIILRFNDLKASQDKKLLKDIHISITQLNKVIHNTSKLEKIQLQSPRDLSRKQDFNLLPTSSTRTFSTKRSNLKNQILVIYNFFKKTFFQAVSFDSLLSLPQRGYFAMQGREFLQTEGSALIAGTEKIPNKYSLSKKERVLSKQKRSRKEFKLLGKKSESRQTYFNSNDLSLSLQSAIPSRKKRSLPKAEMFQSESFVPSIENETFGRPNKIADFLGSLNFKRKRTPQRRSRIRRGRGVFRKRTLTDSVKQDLKTFYKHKSDPEGSVILSTINQKLYSLVSGLIPSSTSQLLQGREGAAGNTPLFRREESKSLLQKGSPFFIKSDEIKQRKSKQRKQRSWKQKRAKFSQKRKKFRKRRRYTISKIRSLSKQFKRVKNQMEIQNWWWKQFIPSIQTSNEALWQIEKDKLIQQKLSQLSVGEILERDSLNNVQILQIGNKDFKPLALPETMQNMPFVGDSLPFGREAEEKLTFPQSGSFRKRVPRVAEALVTTQSEKHKEDSKGNFIMLNKLYENLFTNKTLLNKGTAEFQEFMLPNTGLPFYAGWDESLRKFVVTNRMLSRQDAGYEISLPTEGTTKEQRIGRGDVLLHKNQSSLANSLEFSQAPLRGMNAATTLYWQIPFTTYDPDQFFALGMDGFSPIGWRKFLFRHSVLKTWLNTLNSDFPNTNLRAVTSNEKSAQNGSLQKEILVGFSPLGDKKEVKGLIVKPSIESRLSDRSSLNGSFREMSLKSGISKNMSSLIATLKNSYLTPMNANKPAVSSFPEGRDSLKNPTLGGLKESPSKVGSDSTEGQSKKALAFSRRLKKRYRRVKKHPRTPVWFPSGPLLNQVLPVHYIYVFYKRSRLPRDRYLKRRLLNVKNKSNASLPLSEKDGESSIGGQKLRNSSPEYFAYDFTLRKRLKPKRKYHLKGDSSNIVIPRRLRFLASSSLLTGSSIQKWRPLPTLKVNKPIAELVKEQKLLRSKQRRKELSTKQPNIRVKQLRRRIQRQVLRSVWRYRPRAGGFVWPGDYLKLEFVKGPNLQTKESLKNTVGDVLGVAAEIEGIPSVGLPSETLSASSPAGMRLRKGKSTKSSTQPMEWQIQPKKYLYEKHNMQVSFRKKQRV